jgi:hypothetical protein
MRTLVEEKALGALDIRYQNDISGIDTLLN